MSQDTGYGQQGYSWTYLGSAIRPCGCIFSIRGEQLWACRLHAQSREKE